jgi:hypothetical protein
MEALDYENDEVYQSDCKHDAQVHVVERSWQHISVCERQTFDPRLKQAFNWHEAHVLKEKLW